MKKSLNDLKSKISSEMAHLKKTEGHEMGLSRLDYTRSDFAALSSRVDESVRTVDDSGFKHALLGSSAPTHSSSLTRNIKFEKAFESSFPILEPVAQILSDGLIIPDMFAFLRIDELPLSALEQARLSILVAFVHEAAAALLKRHGSAVKNRLSEVRKKEMSDQVNKADIRELGDFGLMIGRHAFRKTSITFLSTTMIKSEVYYKSFTLNQYLSQFFETV